MKVLNWLSGRFDELPRLFFDNETPATRFTWNLGISNTASRVVSIWVLAATGCAPAGFRGWKRSGNGGGGAPVGMMPLHSTGWHLPPGWRPLSVSDTSVSTSVFRPMRLRWRGCRLPTSGMGSCRKWQLILSSLTPEGITIAVAILTSSSGDCWEWTASPYRLSGHWPLPGALGEYNGKLCPVDDSAWRIMRHAATHIRATYMFLSPATRGSSQEYVWPSKGSQR
jgi:hypothetical protein